MASLKAGGGSLTRLLRRAAPPAAPAPSPWPLPPVAHAAAARCARRAAHSSSSSSSAAAAAPRSPLDAPFVLTLERAVGERAGSDCEIAATGLFGAEVFPDLPISTSWEGLYKAMLKWVSGWGVEGP